VGEVFCGRPVIGSESANPMTLTLSVVVVGRPLSARERLREYGISHLDYFSFLRHTNLKAERVSYISDPIDWNLLKPSGLGLLRDCLSDDLSQETLDRVVRFRRDFDLDAMTVFSDKQKVQYLEPFIVVPSDGVFLDVGAFDGYTSASVLSTFGGDVQCLLFEPLPRMQSLLKQKFGKHLGVKVFNFGLSSFDGVESFGDSGSASRLGTGSQTVAVKRLDSLGLERVDFVKVDIEGAEEDFLDGAEQTIMKCQPQLAIACYHSNRQLIEVFRKARKLLPDARVFLRHYTEGFAETDLFFIPPRFW